MKKIAKIISFLSLTFFCAFPFLVFAKEVNYENLISIQSLELDSEPLKSEEITCESIFKTHGSYNALYYALQQAFDVIKLMAPILVIILSTIDYIKAITSHDADGLKKANEKFVKRLIIGILIFLLPYLLDFVFETFGIYDLETCGIGK